MRVGDEGVSRCRLGRATALAIVLGLAFAPAASAKITGAVGGMRNYVEKELALSVVGSEDQNAGLRSASAVLAGQTVAVRYFGDRDCEVGGPVECPQSGSSLVLPFDSRPFADGDYRFQVFIEDGAGRSESVFDDTITIDNVKPPRNCDPEDSDDECSQTISIGSGATRPPGSGPPGGGENPPGGGATGCRSPQLSVFLAQNPLRIRRGKPVLVRGRKYRFRGRLTCRVGGRRRPAPKGTTIRVVSRVRGRVVGSRTITVRTRGRLRFKLAYRSSRKLVFRVRSASGKRVRVKLPIRVVKLKRGRR